MSCPDQAFPRFADMRWVRWFKDPYHSVIIEKVFDWTIFDIDDVDFETLGSANKIRSTVWTKLRDFTADSDESPHRIYETGAAHLVDNLEMNGTGGKACEGYNPPFGVRLSASGFPRSNWPWSENVAKCWCRGQAKLRCHFLEIAVGKRH